MLLLTIKTGKLHRVVPVTDYAHAFNVIKETWFPGASEVFFRRVLSAKTDTDLSDTLPNITVMIMIAHAVIPSIVNQEQP